MFASAESRYNQWVREHYRFLLRSAWALTGSRAIAEDVVQDCFTSAWKHRAQLRQPELARAWLFRIMRRSALRQLAPWTESLDDESAAHDSAATESGLDDRLDVVKALRRPAHGADGRGAGDRAGHRAVAPGAGARCAEGCDGTARPREAGDSGACGDRAAESLR
jgi:hypothetical protein